MKKHFTFPLLVVVMSLSTPLYAQQADVNHYYIGAGASYAIENFEEGTDFDDSWGIDAKIGYHLHPQIDIEFDFNYLFEFEDEDKWEVLDRRFEENVDLDVATYMFVIKGCFPTYTERAKLALILGGGMMHAQADFKLKGDGISVSDSTDDTELCGKVGLALELLATENISFGIEGSYSTGSLDELDIEYFNITGGIAYHF